MEVHFTESELRMLKERQRRASDRSIYIKYTVLIMLHNKVSIDTISMGLGISNFTVENYYKHYKSSGDFDEYIQTNYKPYLGKLTESDKANIRQYVRENLCHCSDKVRLYIKDKFGINYSADGVVKLLHRLGFVYKKTVLIPSGLSAEKQEEWVLEFRKIEAGLTADEVILFGDGVHPHHNTESENCWIEKGKTFEVLSNTGRKRININGAINPYNPTEIVMHECETINAVTTVELLKKIETKFSLKKSILLIVDNAKYYHSKIVQEYLKTSRIRMLFLPSYSPNLNPIERLWKYLKQKIIKSHYTENFTIFVEKIRDFFIHIEEHKTELATRINTNFHLNLSPAK
jgi:transposase